MPEEKPKNEESKPRLSIAHLKSRMDNHEESVKETIANLQNEVNRLSGVVDNLENRFGRLEIAAPPALRALEFNAVAEILKSNPYAEFEVLQTWQRHNKSYAGGQTIRSDHHPRLLDHVRAGLRLGVPQKQAEAVQRYRDEAKAQEELNRQALIARSEEAVEDAKRRALAARET